MTVEQLGAAHQRRPFKPSRLQTADGREIEVRFPECLSFSRTGRTIAVATPDDTIRAMDVLLVVATDPVNGSGKLTQRKRRLRTPRTGVWADAFMLSENVGGT